MIIPLLRVALISKQENTCGFYRNLFAGRENIILETYASVNDLRMGCQNKNYAGLMVDMWTHIGSPSADKEFIYSLDRVFPILYIGDQDQKPAELDPVGDWRMTCQHEIKILEDFIQNQCRPMKPRGIRADARKDLFLNTHAQFHGQEKSFRTNTWNVSPNGCFLISPQEQPHGTFVRLTITDWEDKAMISGEIKWSRPWGGDFRYLPGMGIAFKETSPDQDRALAAFLK
jgi:hypothetical protein